MGRAASPSRGELSFHQHAVRVNFDDEHCFSPYGGNFLCLVTPTIHFSPKVWCLARLRREKKICCQNYYLKSPSGKRPQIASFYILFLTKNRLKNSNRGIVPLVSAGSKAPAARKVRASPGLGPSQGRSSVPLRAAVSAPKLTLRTHPALQVHGALLPRQRSGPGPDEQLLHRAGHAHQLQHLLL